MKKDRFFIAVSLLSLVYQIGYAAAFSLYGRQYTLTLSHRTFLLPVCLSILMTLAITTVLARFREHPWISVAFWEGCATSVTFIALASRSPLTWSIPIYAVYLAAIAPSVAAKAFVRNKIIRPYFQALLGAEFCLLAGWYVWPIVRTGNYPPIPAYCVFAFYLLYGGILVALFFKVSRVQHGEELQEEIDSIGAS